MTALNVETLIYKIFTGSRFFKCSILTLEVLQTNHLNQRTKYMDTKTE